LEVNPKTREKKVRPTGISLEKKRKSENNVKKKNDKRDKGAPEKRVRTTKKSILPQE